MSEKQRVRLLVLTLVLGVVFLMSGGLILGWYGSSGLLYSEVPAKILVDALAILGIIFIFAFLILGLLFLAKG